MINKEKANLLFQEIKKHELFIHHCFKIFEILEGDLLKYVKLELENQLSADSAREALQRCAPINILKKINDKLSKIYSLSVERKCTNSTDQELVDYYQKQGIDTIFAQCNFNYNSFKNSGVDLYYNESKRKIKFRVPPSHLFVVFGNDPFDPMEVTELAKVMSDGSIYFIDKENFVKLDKNGEVIQTGENIYQVIPFEYISKSKNLLMPIQSSDDYSMTVLLPVLLSDLNFSAKYLSHPIVYGVDVNAENLKRSPNVFWKFATEIDGKTPQIGSITPEADLNGIMQNIKEQLAMWLESKNIKASAVSGEDTSASGLALMIRNVDTSEDRKQQAVSFAEFERRFWQKLAVIHNYHASFGQLENNLKFSDEIENINIIYPQQIPIEDTDAILDRIIKKKKEGFLTQKQALKELNPTKSDTEIEVLIEEIKEENKIELPKVENGGTTEGGN